MGNINSALVLKKLVFDKIEFTRKGFKNDCDLVIEFKAQVGINEDKTYKVSLESYGSKKDEYDFVISLSGFFSIDFDEKIDDNLKETIIQKNTIAIMMPYMRSEITLLTSQPETECVVLQPLNINSIIKPTSN